MRWLPFIFILLLTAKVAAQNWNLVYAKETEAEILLGEKQYEKAAQKFKEALKVIPQSASLMYKVGFCYLLTDDKKSEAIEFLENAARNASPEFDPRSIKETNAPMEAHYHLGRAYQMVNKLDLAIEQYEIYRQSLKPNDSFLSTVDLRIASCKRAKEAIRNSITFRSTNLGEAINNSGSNFNAVFSDDGNTMAYTTLGRRGYEVFVSKKVDGAWGKPTNITKQLAANVKTSSLNAAGNELYLVDDFDPNSDIYVSTLVGKKWIKAERLPKNINSKHSETHATISKDGNTLYFVSNRPGGVGGLDIYKVERDAKGKWGKPQILSSNVNTPFNEDTPFLSADQRFLFFSSEGHNSIGGYDIFYIDLKGNGNPVNLGYPINTTADNTFFFPGLKANTGYLAMHNEGSLGANDIYFVEILPQVTLMASIAGSPKAKGPISVSIQNRNENRTEKELQLESNQLQFEHKLLPGNYQISLKAEGFQSFSTTINIPDDYSKPDFWLELPLKAIEKPTLIATVTEPAVVSAPLVIKPEPKQVEEPKPSSTAKPLPAPESKPKTKEVERNIPKPDVKPEVRRVAQTTPSVSSASVFTVQIMALRNPVAMETIPNVPNLNIVAGSDGYYRYVVGKTQSREEAILLQQQLIQQGYKDAFIRVYPTTGKYTLQIMALKNPVGIDFFANIPNVSVERGDDNLYRYFAGEFDTIEQAKVEMARILKLGYKEILIRSR